MDTFSESRSAGTGKEIKDGWNIELQLVEENMLQITVVAQNNSWVGLILGGHDIMDSGNDIVVVSANDKQSYCLDKYTVGETTLKDDSDQSIEHCKVRITRGGERDNEIWFFMKRKLDTGDTNGQDFVVPLDAGFELGYVINEETADVSKWPTFESSIYQVKYNPIKVHSDGTPTYNFGFSGAFTGVQLSSIATMVLLAIHVLI